MNPSVKTPELNVTPGPVSAAGGIAGAQPRGDSVEMVKEHAERLVRELGSVDLAKQAVAAVADTIGDLPQTEHQAAFAKANGFGTFAELQKASTAVPSNDGAHWYIVQPSSGSWVVWNEQGLQGENRQFASREEALASVPHNDDFTGTSLLG
jgi:hypothetical protein